MTPESGPPGRQRLGWGYKLPSCGGVLCRPEWATPATIDELAATALAAGFDSLWLHDHVVLPAELAHLDRPNFLEPLVTATRIATTFQDATVGIATIVLPLREPVLFTKQITTMATFFPGRIVAGIGIGRYESEFMAVGSDAYHVRGKATDEALEIIRALFERHAVDYEGSRHRLREAVMYPKPPSVGDPALWIAGNSVAGAHRAGRFGDGWIVAVVPPSDVVELLGAARIARTELGIDRPFRVALSATIRRTQPVADAEASEELHTHKSAIEGVGPEVADQLVEYVRAGVDRFILSLGATSLDQVHADMAWFGSEVIPVVNEVGATAAAVP